MDTDIEMLDYDDGAEEVQPLSTPLPIIIQNLCSLDLNHVTSRTVEGICNQLSSYQANDGGCIPLGSYLGADYYLSPGPLLGGSFNNLDDREEHPIPEIVKRIKCYSRGSDVSRAVLAIAIGRLGVKFNSQQPIMYTCWVLLMDHKNNAMAMFSGSVDQYEHLPHPFTDEFVPVFATKASLGESIIEFGSLAHCFPYTEGQKIKNPYIYKQTSWVAQYADFAEDGHLYPARKFRLTVAPETIDCLQAGIDLSYLTIPKYRGKIRLSSTNIQKLDIVAVRDFIGFQTFMKDLAKANDKVVVGRKVAEAAWCAAILKTFVFQNEYPREPAHTYNFDKSVEAVSDCLLQAAFSAKFSPIAYWEKKRSKYPGLDVTVSHQKTSCRF